MIIRIDQTSTTPLYLQIRAQIIAGIAAGELAVGDALPSVRALAADLGINLHTVNKAYAVLRDEGYVFMKGRSGAFIAEPAQTEHTARTESRIAHALGELVREHKAAGGTAEAFLMEARAQVDAAYGIDASKHSSLN